MSAETLRHPEHHTVIEGDFRVVDQMPEAPPTHEPDAAEQIAKARQAVHDITSPTGKPEATQPTGPSVFVPGRLASAAIRAVDNYQLRKDLRHFAPGRFTRLYQRTKQNIQYMGWRETALNTGRNLKYAIQDRMDRIRYR